MVGRMVIMAGKTDVQGGWEETVERGHEIKVRGKEIEGRKWDDDRKEK
jgi:hypothetical protein